MVKLMDPYERLRNGAGVVSRSDRRLLQVTGRDRAGWLHNLLTNDVKGLHPGQGCYAFALNIKGRILFDAQVLIMEEHLWLDLDQRWADAALQHLTKYIIMEDVVIRDITADIQRYAAIGQWTGVSDRSALEGGQHTEVNLGTRPVRLYRSDYCGWPTVEIFSPVENSPNQDEWIERMGWPWISAESVEILRVEQGMPWPLTELNDQVLPAETGQLHRAVSFKKGCYLGQEVVERMRAHSAVARHLVGLHLGSVNVVPGTELLLDGQAVGRVTSVADSVMLGKKIGLGYVKSAVAVPGTILNCAGAISHQVAVAALPFTP
ncbi:MAG: Aminomethyltransferase [Phycisphaerae bacterium]|nr:Aminomethyltransferase [Phycisphaerae bacterium]